VRDGQRVGAAGRHADHVEPLELHHVGEGGEVVREGGDGARANGVGPTEAGAVDRDVSDVEALGEREEVDHVAQRAADRAVAVDDRAAAAGSGLHERQATSVGEAQGAGAVGLDRGHPLSSCKRLLRAT
jgi:hypothetical protein